MSTALLTRKESSSRQGGVWAYVSPSQLACWIACPLKFKLQYIDGEDLGIPLVGIVDLVLAGENGPVLADFKTTARSSQPMEIVHEIQLTSYAYMLREVMQRQEAGLEIRSLIKTKVPKVEFHRYPARMEAHFRRLLAVVHEYLDALDAGRFNYRPGFGCGMCEHHETHCRSWCG